jgi:hypothetical protein
MGAQSSWADKRDEPTDGVAIPRMKNVFAAHVSMELYPWYCSAIRGPNSQGQIAFDGNNGRFDDRKINGQKNDGKKAATD